MKEALLVNLFAGPGALKSGTAAGIFTLLKLHGVDVDLPYEYPKDLVWEERAMAFDDQNYIFGNQFHRLWRVKNKVDVIICDSPILFSLVYRRNGSSDHFYNNVLHSHKSFNNLNIFVKRNDSVPYEENGRNESLKEAIDLDTKLKKVLKDNNVSYHSIIAGEESINWIAKIILAKFDKEIKYEIKEI